MDPITAYLQSISPNPELYDTWQQLNDQLFGGELKPIPVLVGLSGHGKHSAFCAVDHIALQPSTFASGDWVGVLAHEMAHQADHQAGVAYTSIGRVQNIHNSTAWCDRINGLMKRLGDPRFAAPYKRNRNGQMIATAIAPAGLEMIPYEELKSWEPANL